MGSSVAVTAAVPGAATAGGAGLTTSDAGCSAATGVAAGSAGADETAAGAARSRGVFCHRAIGTFGARTRWGDTTWASLSAAAAALAGWGCAVRAPSARAGLAAELRAGRGCRPVSGRAAPPADAASPASGAASGEAHATPDPVVHAAAPIPRATAKPPTRPIKADPRIVESPSVSPGELRRNPPGATRSPPPCSGLCHIRDGLGDYSGCYVGQASDCRTMQFPAARRPHAAPKGATPPPPARPGRSPSASAGVAAR